MLSILSAAVLMAVIVLIHEAGHFAAAKRPASWRCRSSLWVLAAA